MPAITQKRVRRIAREHLSEAAVYLEKLEALVSTGRTFDRTELLRIIRSIRSEHLLAEHFLDIPTEGEKKV